MAGHKFVAALTIVNAGLLAMLLAGGTPGGSQDGSPPSVVRAQAIELVDAAGNVRGQLHLGADGGGNLRLRAGNGEVRVKIGAAVKGGGLMFADERTEPVVQLAAGGQRGTNLTLAAPDKKPRVIAP